MANHAITIILINRNILVFSYHYVKTVDSVQSQHKAKCQGKVIEQYKRLLCLMFNEGKNCDFI